MATIADLPKPTRLQKQLGVWGVHALATGATLLALVVGTSPLEGQEIRGILSEQGTYTPIDLGQVVLVDDALDTLAVTLTDESGFFRFELQSSGEYYVIASALGYQALRSESLWVGAGEVRIVEISMETRPVPVEGLLVEADAQEPQVAELRGTGFYDRMAEGRGEFITPGQIAASTAAWPQQLFWGTEKVRVQQLSHERPGPWDDVLVIPNRASRGYCRPSIYVDGVWVREENMAPGASLPDVVRKEEILAVEIYEWPFGVPRIYTGKQQCGVILFWTEFVDERGA